MREGGRKEVSSEIGGVGEERMKEEVWGKEEVLREI